MLVEMVALAGSRGRAAYLFLEQAGLEEDQRLVLESIDQLAEG